MTRFLTAKALRNALWIAAEGRCQFCGTPLEEGWHADHVVPWSTTHETNVHEMQALCPICNTRKGASAVTLRAHQRAFWALMKEIRGGTRLKRVWVHVTPGGGKSLLPVIAASELLGPFADKLCWVVPRTTLQEQAAQAFMDPRFRAVLSHSRVIRESTNETDPSRGNAGYVTTYQALGQDAARINAAEFRRHRYILFLDEPHHLETGGSWMASVAPLVELAALTVFMTGTLDRGNGKQVGFLPYSDPAPDGTLSPAPASDTSGRFIRYTRTEALHERAIIRMHVTRIDCRAEWTATNGDSRTVESITSAGEDTSAALWTALTTEYAAALLTQTVEHWRAHRRANQRAKLLVVAPSIAHAKKYAERLTMMGVAAEWATADDSPAALSAIRRFKTDACNALVTVQMAYEGLEQMLARATRCAGPPAPGWDQQIAYVFAPDDAPLTEAIRSILEEQEAACRVSKDTDGGPDRAPVDRPTIVPQGSEATRTRAHSGEDGETDYAETDRLMSAAQAAGILGCSALQLKQFAASVGWVDAPPESLELQPSLPLVTPRQSERNLRSSIQARGCQIDRQRGREPGTANKEIIRFFRKRREEMTLPELQSVWSWLNRTYPTA